ncbi:MAG: hypothetical protein HQK76_14695 [Desulfobacterales bacterium]|nr:hypothetical protein [Desulfobacterales bacterium]
MDLNLSMDLNLTNEKILDMKWGITRFLFLFYLAFCLVTVFGVYITAPIGSKLFFNSWRFWRYLPYAHKLLIFGYRMVFVMLKGKDDHKFLFSVPLSDPPLVSPDLSVVKLSNSWENGYRCDSCTNCCSKINCPLLEKETGKCISYNSFYWRYFMCGRFPFTQGHIDYYGCEKWEMHNEIAA